MIFDNLGSLVSDLKYKCTNIEIYVCDTVPAQTLQEINDKIRLYNEKLIRWAEANGVIVIKTTPVFTLSTGEVDEMCFNIANDTRTHIFNRLGLIRLLDTINKQCPEFQLCTKWSENKRSLSFIVHTKPDKNTLYQHPKQQSQAHQYITSHHKTPLSTVQSNVNAPHQLSQVKAAHHYPTFTTSQEGTSFTHEKGEHTRHPQPTPTIPTRRPPFYSQFLSPSASHPSLKTNTYIASTPVVKLHQGFGGTLPLHGVAQHRWNVTRPRLSDPG